MKIAITADSVIDMPVELREKFDVKVIPMEILLGDDLYFDGEITNEQIFEFVGKTGVLPKTSAVNTQRFTEFFESVLKDYDAIVHFDISSHMSATFNNARVAAEAFGGKVEVIDTQTLSTGMALLAIYARELTKTESDVCAIAEKVRARVSSVQASFIVDRLDFLYKGGRCSSLALLGANLLRIKPQIIVKNGKMGSYKKYRGHLPMVIKKYCHDTLEEFNNPDKSIAFITYSSASQEMVNSAYEVLKEAGFENVYETQAGCTVTSHCGPNTLGILYFNDGIN